MTQISKWFWQVVGRWIEKVLRRRWKIVFWSPTHCFQSRAPGKIIFQGLSSGEMVRLEESFQDLGLGDSQCGAPQLLRKIVASFTKMSTLRLELPRFGFPARSSRGFIPLLEVQRGPPHDLTQNAKIEQDLILILKGFETALQNSFLSPHPLLSVQSYRRNSISGTELWRSRPFNVELPGFDIKSF